MEVLGDELGEGLSLGLDVHNVMYCYSNFWSIFLCNSEQRKTSLIISKLKKTGCGSDIKKKRTFN